MAKPTAVDGVLTASRALVGVAARSLAETEDTVTLVQYRALVLLASRGEMNVGNLAEALGVHQSTATRLCDRLVSRGLVEREIAPDNRREVLVSLTRVGEKLIRAVTARRRAEIDAVLARVTAKDRVAITAALLVFAEAAGEAPDDAWKLGWTA